MSRATGDPRRGEIFLTFGVIGLLFISYLIWGTVLRAESAQRQLSAS